jgi:hypothetical protein
MPEKKENKSAKPKTKKKAAPVKKSKAKKKDAHILLLDFDGVIHEYMSPWCGASKIPDRPVEGALEFIVDAMQEFDVAIYSSRSNQRGGVAAMKKWLKKYYLEIGENRDKCPEWFELFVESKKGEERVWKKKVERCVDWIIKNISFPKTKPPAFLTIDDRCIQMTTRHRV